MSINRPYSGPSDMPRTIPVFPLEGALLLPRGHLPLNIFEKRYMAMVDDTLAGRRLIGMVQPANLDLPVPGLRKIGSIGRITQIAETGDGRYHLTLTGICRFRIIEELEVTTPYRQCHIDCSDFPADFIVGAGEAEIDRNGIIESLRKYSKANQLKIDWKEIDKTPGEALVNALSMMGPFDPDEKQALLEACDLKARAAMLVAITEIAINKSSGGTPTLQ